MPEDHHDHRLPNNPFRLWAFGDAHVGTDKRYGRQSLAEAITHSESGGSEGGPPFEWDIAIDVGDMSGAHHHLPDDAEGSELRHQFGSLRRHRREAIYSVCGNHDRSGLHQPEAWWWQKWVDPLGQHTEFSGVDAAARPYPVEGAWDHYSFRVATSCSSCSATATNPPRPWGGARSAATRAASSAARRSAGGNTWC